MNLTEYTKLAMDYCSNGSFARDLTYCYPNAQDQICASNITLGQHCIDCSQAAQNSGLHNFAVGLSLAVAATALIAGAYYLHLNKKRQ